MAFLFPKTAAASQQPEAYGQLLTVGSCRSVIGSALVVLHDAYGSVDKMDYSNADLLAGTSSLYADDTAPQRSQAAASLIGTLDDTRTSLESFYTGVLASAGTDKDAAAPDIQRRALGLSFAAWYTASVVDSAVGSGWSGQIADLTTAAINQVAGSLIDRAGDAIKAIAKIPETGLDSLAALLKAIGYVGYVVLAIAALLAISIAISITKKGGKLNAGPVALES